MLVYAIILNQAHPSSDIGFQTCLGLYNDYDIAHAEWKKLMRDPPSGDVNGLYWTAWPLEEEVLDGLDNELRIAEWCPISRRTYGWQRQIYQGGIGKAFRPKYRPQRCVDNMDWRCQLYRDPPRHQASNLQSRRNNNDWPKSRVC